MQVLAGVIVLLLLILAVLWAGREEARPFGFGGLFIGLGGGIVGLIALANMRCSASNVSGPNYASGCEAPDLTALFVAAGLLVAIGIRVSSIAVARAGKP